MTGVAEIGFVPMPRDGEPVANMQVNPPEVGAVGDSFGFAGTSVRGPNSGPRICARRGCERSVPPQTGPGARRIYCSPTCKKRAGSRASTRVAAPRRPVGDFGRRLREAIEDSSLKLATISRRLDEEDGVTVRPSTISNWQNGSLPRRGIEDNTRIFALERVLGLRRSELFLLLSKERQNVVTPLARHRPHDDIEAFKADVDRRGGVNGYVTTAIRDHVLIDVDRREKVRTVRQTIRAIESDRVDCYWAFYCADAIKTPADVRCVSGCRPGRFVTEGRFLGIELLFDQVVPLGGTHTFEFSVFPHGVPEPFVRRATGSPALETLDMTVEFEAEPEELWLAEWETLTAPPRLRGAGLTGRTVRLSHRDPVPGYVGMVWSW